MFSSRTGFEGPEIDLADILLQQCNISKFQFDKYFYWMTIDTYQNKLKLNGMRNKFTLFLQPSNVIQEHSINIGCLYFFRRI